ncbi:MAG: hypothetical protein Q7R80_05085 [bacterium]|nr:hypothetical protein [bacterium]
MRRSLRIAVTEIPSILAESASVPFAHEQWKRAVACGRALRAFLLRWRLHVACLA